MERTETLERMERPFSLSMAETTEFLFKIEKQNLGPFMSRPVNNYLKTPAEIEAECLLASWGGHSAPEPGTRSILTQDGYRDIHNPDEILSGDMEENY